MLNKIALMSLNDYIEDPTPINLKLFVLSVNPNAKVDKNLKILIDKYKIDTRSPKLRLFAIENLLRSVKTKTVVKTTKINYLPNITPENKEKLGELAEIKKRYVSNLGRTGSKQAMEENEVLRQKIDDLEFDMGLKFDYKEIPKEGVELSEKSILLGVLGDWNDSNSISWELINGSKNYFEVVDSGKQNTSAFGMEGLLKYLTKYSGKPIRPFNVAFVFPQGNANAKAKWTFSMTTQMSSVAMMSNSLQGYSNELGMIPK